MERSKEEVEQDRIEQERIDRERHDARLAELAKRSADADLEATEK
jgi:hypothetical protein